MPNDLSLYKAFTQCKNEKEFQLFITDLLSKAEIERAEKRWDVACIYLSTPNCTKTYAENQSKASQGLVERVFKTLEEPNSGYQMVYERLQHPTI